MWACRATSLAARLLASRAGSALPRQQQAAGRRLHAAAAVAAAAPGGGRPSKTAAKQEAQAFQDMARQLSRLTEKQLARLTPLVGEEVVDAVALAARIDRRNQGRGRQESLVARLLRESLDGEAGAQQLQAAIDSVRTGQGVIANPAVERQLQLWMAALASGDAAATTQVFALVQASGGDLQQVRQLLRQAQQVEAAPAPTAADGEGGEGGSGSEAAAARGGTAPPRPTAKARAASKQLRKLLQPLAAAQIAEAEEEEEGA